MIFLPLALPLLGIVYWQLIVPMMEHFKKWSFEGKMESAYRRFTIHRLQLMPRKNEYWRDMVDIVVTNDQPFQVFLGVDATAWGKNFAGSVDPIAFAESQAIPGGYSTCIRVWAGVKPADFVIRVHTEDGEDPHQVCFMRPGQHHIPNMVCLPHWYQEIGALLGLF